MFLKTLAAKGGIPSGSLLRRAGLPIFVIKFERSKVQGKAPKGLLDEGAAPTLEVLPVAVSIAEVDLAVSTEGRH